jgi:hypothetical protein
MRPYRKFILITALVAAGSALFASSGEAQWRRYPRTRIAVYGTFGYPYYSAFYSPFYRPFWYGSYWGPYYPQYPADWQPRPRTVPIRLDVEPESAQVFVDGYFSGTASDFDGAFKRLRVSPGRHELVLYLRGHRTVRQTLDLRLGTEPRIRERLEPLGAGEPQDPPPSAPPPAERVGEPEPSRQRAEAPQAAPVPSPDEPRRRSPRPPRADAVPVDAEGFGTLAVRVQPGGAEVLIDGERWQGPDAAAPLVLQLAEGPHRVEVRKDGYTTFTTEVTVRQGESRSLNVSLPQQK